MVLQNFKESDTRVTLGNVQGKWSCLSSQSLSEGQSIAGACNCSVFVASHIRNSLNLASVNKELRK